MSDIVVDGKTYAGQSAIADSLSRHIQIVQETFSGSDMARQYLDALTLRLTVSLRLAAELRSEKRKVVSGEGGIRCGCCGARIVVGKKHEPCHLVGCFCR